jgi:hypothetical protein
MSLNTTGTPVAAMSAADGRVRLVDAKHVSVPTVFLRLAVSTTDAEIEELVEDKTVTETIPGNNVFDDG